MDIIEPFSMNYVQVTDSETGEETHVTARIFANPESKQVIGVIRPKCRYKIKTAKGYRKGRGGELVALPLNMDPRMLSEKALFDAFRPVPELCDNCDLCYLQDEGDNFAKCRAYRSIVDRYAPHKEQCSQYFDKWRTR